MKYVFAILIIITIIMLPLYKYGVYAGRTNDILNHERLHHEKIVKDAVQAHNNFEQYRLISNSNLEKYHNTVETIKAYHISNKAFIKPAPQAIIFISFSMPDSSLKQIINDATKYKVPVVIRGLYENSFRKTVEKMFDLVKENNKCGVLINPNWFKQYDIKAVPALVIGNGDTKDNKDFDVVYGNILLKRMLTIIAEQGTNANVAKDILDGVKL